LSQTAKVPKKTPEPRPLVIKFGTSRPYKGLSVKLKQEVKDKKKKLEVASAGEGQTRTINNVQTTSVTLYRKVKLIHFSQDPYESIQKELMEATIRRNFCARLSLWVREQMAYRKSKLVIELTDSDKLLLSEEDAQKKLEGLKNDKKNREILKNFDVRDNNLKLPQMHVKVLAWQGWMFGRGAIIILYEDDSYKKIKRLYTPNSRRLGNPVLDEENDLSFEGCIIDGEGLDKDSMIYATYQERNISPHTEGFGYSPTEPIIYFAEAHNIFLEEDTPEISKSAWLPSITLKVITEGLTQSQKSTQIQNITDVINPGKITGISAEDIEGEPSVLDMKPDFRGILEFIDSLEEKIYNNYHIPLFAIKSDAIANLATARKSIQLFIEGTVADDQQWMEDVLAEQWYDPLLREELARGGILEKTANTQEVNTKSVDLSQPEDAEAPLPFLIRRKFEKPVIDDFLDLAQALGILKQNSIWGEGYINKNILKTPEASAELDKLKQERTQMEEQKMNLQRDLGTQKIQMMTDKQKADAVVASASLTKMEELRNKEMEQKTQRHEKLIKSNDALGVTLRSIAEANS